MTKIYLVRHAEAEGNLYRRMHGHYDSDITDNGQRQIEALAERFKGEPIHAAYSSDLRRTMKTAQAVTESRGLRLVSTPALREIGVGIWEDVPFGEIEIKYPEQLSDFNNRPLHWKIEGSEPYENVVARMSACVREIAERHDGQTVALFSHGCAIRAFLFGSFGYTEETLHEIGHCDNTGVTLVTYDNGKFELVWKNDNSHLSAEISTLARQSWWREGKSSSDHNLWFKPLGGDSEQYIAFRLDAWRHVYGSENGCDGPGFLRDARRCCEGEPDALVYAMLGTRVAGLLQLNPPLDAAKGVGYIPFFYMREEFRNRGLGVQLFGHATSFFRQRGRSRLQLSVAPVNEHAIHFYVKYGFEPVGRGRGKNKELILMEKKI